MPVPTQAATGAASRRLSHIGGTLIHMQADEDTTVKSLPTKVEEVALEIGAAMSGSEIFRMSIHDTTGATAWISRGALDESEQVFVLDALDSFALEPARLSCERSVDGHRGLVAFAARDPRGALHGALLLDLDLVTLGGRPNDRFAPPRLSRLLQQMALRLAGAQPRPIAPMGDVDGMRITLYVQQLLKLRSTGRTRRYEVLLRADDGADPAPQEAPREMLARAEEPASGGNLDRVVLSELLNWLNANRKQLDVDPAVFSVNLSTGAILNEPFLGFVEKSLRDARINPRQVGFEIREIQCRQHHDEVLRFIQLCEKVGCYIVIDDFSFHSDVLPLLRQRAVRMLKIDTSLTVQALNDKVSQAQVAAISHASRVLGMHCVAKRIESPLARQWLAAIGVDFAQGYLLEGPLPITELHSLRLEEPVAR
jgi:EAL domain-containing protein (putative c-di-GMP-specific phosphodiesterase class I)